MDARPTGDHAGWTRDAYSSVEADATGGVYSNALGAESAARVRAAYGSNYDRLREVKRRWDPDNLFRLNQNIDPS